MFSLESVRNLHIDYVESVSLYGDGNDILYDTKKWPRKILDAFYNLSVDTSHSPESIVHQLGTLTSGLEGFSANILIRFEKFLCLEH